MYGPDLSRPDLDGKELASNGLSVICMDCCVFIHFLPPISFQLNNRKGGLKRKGQIQR